MNEVLLSNFPNLDMVDEDPERQASCRHIHDHWLFGTIYDGSGSQLQGCNIREK